MDESEDNMNSDEIKIEINHNEKEKPKKRSLVERELETSLTSYITSPITAEDGTTTSRFGRARRLKNNTDFCDTDKSVTSFLKSSQYEKSPNIKAQPTSPVYKMQASNSLIHETSPKSLTGTNLENQIENIYNTNVSLSRFGSDEKNDHSQSPAKKFSKTYVRKDLIQSKEKDDPVTLIRHMFSPTKSTHKSNNHLSNILERSSEKYDLCNKTQNGYLDTSSVVKTLDFDCSKKKRKDRVDRETKSTFSKSDLFDLEAKCEYQVGDIAWARMGTFPFWPCIITREPGTEIFVRVKLFGKVEHNIIHVTFFGDNGRRSWILDSMLRKYQGLAEFETTRDQFTPEAKKKDPKLYAAFFISEKKLVFWHAAIDEADMLQREPKRLRMDLLYELLGLQKVKHTPLKNQKSGKVTRTDSDVSLSETLYDSLFSGDDGKTSEAGNKKNKSLDVSEVVTACLDNMAAKTGMTMIQRQSHMDIWLQKAKSKTPEKMNITVTVERLENESKSKSKERDTRKSKSQDRDSSKKKKKALPREVPIRKPYSFRKSTESQNLLSYHNEHDYSKNIETGNNADNIDGNNSIGNILNDAFTQCDDNPICVIDKIESLRNLEATPESRDGATNKEIQEEIVIDTDHLHDDKIPAEQGNKGDTEVIITQTTDVIKENESISIDVSENSEQKCDQLNATETETYNVEVPITEHANKTTNAFILQTDTQDAKTTSLEQQNLLKTDDKPNLKEPEEICAQKRDSSRMIDNMSIDEDAMICGSSHETSQIFFNTVTDKQNKSESSLLEQLNQQNSIYEKEKNESYQITSTNDMSVDDIPEKTSETLCNSIKELKEYNDDNKVSVTKECLSTLDNCEQGLLPKLYDRGTDNNSEITTNESKNQTGVVTLISKEEMIKEKSTDIPASQAENLNTSELVPKKKLAVIKEANIEKFRNTSIIQIPRRSLRKSGSKKEKQHKPMKEPEFLQYLELRQDAIVDEYPELSQDEIVEYLYKTWQFGSNVHQTHISGHRKSPSDFKKIEDIEFISESHIQGFKGDNSKEDSEVETSKLSVEPNTSNKRSLRLRKSQSPSVPKKREHEQQSNKVITTNTDSISNTVDAISSSDAKVLKHEPENTEEISVNNINHISATQTQENNNLEFENSTTAEEVTDINRYKDKLLSPTGFIVKDVTPAEDVYLLTSKKPGLSLRIPKAAFEPKVLLERKKEMHDRQDKDTQIKSDKKLPAEKEIETITDEEIKIGLSNPETKSMRKTQRSKSYLVLRKLEDNNIESKAEGEINIALSNAKTKPMKRSHRSKSYLLSRNVLEDNNDNIGKQAADGNDSATTSGEQTGSETMSENKTSLIKDAERDTNLDTPRAKSRSLRLRKSQSPSESAKSKQEQNIQSDFSKVADLITENKSNINELSSSDNIANVGDILASQNESSNIITTSVVNKCTNEHSNKTNIIDRTLVDNISLASDLTNGFADHSSDIDFDPDTISLNSMSSEISYNSELLPKIVKVKSEKQNMIQNLLESDNESISSLDDVALSELKKRSQKEETAKILSHSIENSMDSIKSDSSEKRLRLVLTDCLLDAKDSKLPVIKEVSSKTNEEFEISQSRSEISTPNRLVLSKSPVEPKVNGYSGSKAASPELKLLHKIEDNMPDPDTLSIKSSGSEASVKRKGRKQDYKPMEEPEFLKYLEMRQDALIDEHPEVTPSEIAAYLYKTWQYEENLKSDIKKNDDIESANLVKGVNQVIQEPPKKKKGTTKKLINIEKIMAKSPKIDQFVSKNIEQRELPKRKVSKAFYKEDYSDIEEEIEMFEIFNTKKKQQVKIDAIKKETNASEAFKVKEESDSKSSPQPVTLSEEKVEKTIDIKDEAIIDLDNEDEVEEHFDEVESYFEQLTNPKPNVFKGLIREKICEICEKPSNLVKCKGCSGMFHVECVRKEIEIVDTPVPTRGRKKKKKPRGRKPKSSLDSNEEGHSDEKSHDHNVSEENMSIDDVSAPGPIIIPDAENFESQLEAKMKEMIETVDKIEYDSYSSDDGTDWTDTVAGKCEIVDVKPKIRPLFVNTDDFKCKNCQKDDTPICFVCKSPVSPKNNVERRQKCQVAHCHKYYHLECLEHWPQTQFKGGEPSRNNKKIDEHFEALACPRHVCHTCVCDDPRGCKTRFSGDKLARCVRCPATYHSFTKCLPAGSQILSASHIVCPRHYEHRPGKIPYHVNTGWCFICALGGNLICCDYCPTSFHADCLNIEPPEGGYMCEDCETGRLPLYGEMVWVKLGHYRWWPGIVLHPLEIPDNIMAVKHSPGEFVVRFFGQYDHYWVNRGRVFPFQEGDSGRISTQKSKIDEAFTIAMEDAQRAFEILKNIEPNDEENQDIQSSLLPPHYVKLKVNKPCGSLYGKKIDIEESSLTQCDCNPDEEEPCGPYSHCLNRMLLTECGPHCRAGERCQNRAFEKRLYPKLVPYRTSQRGWGLKTLEPIKAGQFVIEYVGELIDETEFRRRMQRKHDTRDENFYFLTLDKERMIDAGPKGNLARFMNHCCEPNCETQKWTVLGDVRVGLFAIHDIPANTEVTFNYNLECTGIEKKPCMCGARRCAGYIGAKPKQEEPQPKKLKLAVKRAYKKRKNTEVQSPSTSKLTKPKRPVGRPAKPRELTDIEKDLLIIKNATNGISSDSEGSSRLSSLDDNTAKALKRKRVSFSTEETVIYNGHSPSVKKMKIEDIDKTEVGD